MILDAKKPNDVSASVTGDTIIVGAGTIGLFLAINLIRANRPVILVETGGHVANTGWNAETAGSLGRPHDGVLLGRAMGLGGTSILWGGQLAEFDEADLAREGKRWPVTYSELCRWYGHVYDMLGITERCSNDVYQRKFGGVTETHSTIERFFTFWLPQPNFATLFYRELVSSPLITVILNATVNEISFKEDRAQWIGATSRGGRRLRISGNNFVFAAGTIENNRFFLSSQRLCNVPWKSNRFVGKYFQDHLIGKIADVDILNDGKLREFFENGFVNRIKLQPKLRLNSAARSQVNVGVSGFFSFDSRLRENLANIKKLIRALKSGTAFSGFSSLPADIWTLSRAFGPLVVRYVRDRRIRAFFDRTLEFHAQVEQLPISHSQICLLGEAPGPDGLFRAGVDWQLDGNEIEVVRNFAIEANSYLQALGIARLIIDPLLEKGDFAFADRLKDNSHQSGGLSMAELSSSGVVDSDCCVWDTKNVYIAGASVFPTSSHANCTLTALALAGRLAKTVRARQ
jgi:choline dehydrogenase-like flavoprotein